MANPFDCDQRWVFQGVTEIRHRAAVTGGEEYGRVHMIRRIDDGRLLCLSLQDEACGCMS